MKSHTNQQGFTYFKALHSIYIFELIRYFCSIYFRIESNTRKHFEISNRFILRKALKYTQLQKKLYTLFSQKAHLSSAPNRTRLKKNSSGSMFNMTRLQTFYWNFGTTWNFFYQPGTIWCGTPKGSHQNHGWGPSPLHLEYSLENTVYSFFWS